MNDSKFGVSRHTKGVGVFDKDYFAEGSSRLAYKGGVKVNEDEPIQDYVLKLYKTLENNTIEYWSCDIDASKKAFEYANKFFQIYKNNNGSSKLPKIEFVRPIVVRLDDYFHANHCCLPFFCKKHKFVAILEEYLPSYIKFSDNKGYESDIEGTNLLFAFSHWTYESSNHKFIVSDLQGTMQEGIFILTDPAVHSVEQKYGFTDLGYVGMQRVLNKHKCNEICKYFGLEPIDKKSEAPNQNPGTRHSDQIPIDEKLTNTKYETAFKKKNISNRQSICSNLCTGRNAIYPNISKRRNISYTFTTKSLSQLESSKDKRHNNSTNVLQLTAIQP